MKLYFFPIAPNPTKVRLYLAEKAAAGRPIDLEPVLVSLPEGEQRGDAHLARNPFGKLPVLEVGPGDFICESLTIIEYLEELHPEPTLIGEGARERARVRELERICDLGVLHGIGRIVHATNSPLGWPPNPAVAEDARPVLARTLGFLDALLADGRAFVAGAQPTIADCTLAAALQFGRFGKCPLDPSFANVARWDERYRARPAVQPVFNV